MSHAAEIKKGQIVRALDVFVLGPFMIYSGAKKSNLNKGIKAGLVALGVSTIIYNGRNFILNLKKGGNYENQEQDKRL